jgi:hypothetical protein
MKHKNYKDPGPTSTEQPAEGAINDAEASAVQDGAGALVE